MRTTLGIEAPIGDTQPLDWLATHQVLRYDLSGILGAHPAIPDRFGINHHRRPMLALVQASGLVRADS
jgi:hypothetical protein